MTHEPSASVDRSALHAEFDPTTFPLVEKGNLFEDFVVEQEFKHHWGKTIGWSEAAAFATSTCAWVPLYTNVEYASALGHPTTPVHPMLVLSTAVGLSVEDLSEAGGPFLGVDDCVFVVPVYPGDTITCRSTVLDARLSSNRPSHGIVTWRTTATNQHDETVLTFVRSNLIARRKS
jgi:itaconyl-CoA hydratase